MAALRCVDRQWFVDGWPICYARLVRRHDHRDCHLLILRGPGPDDPAIPPGNHRCIVALSVRDDGRGRRTDRAPRYHSDGAGPDGASLTVKNEADAETSLQVRAFAWSQSTLGDERLEPTTELMASPPICTITAGASQGVRLVWPPQGGEASYRILLDQIPPPAAPGTVRIALRLSSGLC
jgi:Pili and flagellar-assembly chaperone, PapD N-terminal domain